MATMVYQGLQSLESQLVESRTLRMRLLSPKPHFSQPFELSLKHCFLDCNTKELNEKCHSEDISQKPNFLHDKHTPSNPDLGGWSFLQALSNTSSQGPKESMEKENTYVHPLVKRSSSTLSEKSLELCTENLGSETGTDIIENSIFLSSSSDSKVGNSPTREQQKSRQLLGAKKANTRSFPPPLTTITGSKSLQVRPHREDGRLIIKAVKAPSTHSYFEAERSHGRLRLRFVKDSVSNLDSIGAASTEENEANNKNEEIENDMNYDGIEEEEEKEDFQEQLVEDFEEQLVEEGLNGEYYGEEMDDNELDVEDEMGMEEFQRLSRCSGGELENKGLLNWEPFLVATS